MKRRFVGIIQSRRVLAGIGLAVAVLVGSTVVALRSGRSEEVVSRAPEWFEDLPAALIVANSEKKDILLEFSRSGRDSNAAETLDSALLDKEPFRRAVGKSFVLLRMAPTSRMSPERMTAVATAAQRLGVERFPTFILLDLHGRPYAKSERAAADAASYEEEFLRLRRIRLDRDKLLSLAAEAKGIDRARHLDNALKLVGPFADSEYSDLERQIVELDPQNAAALKSKYESAVAFRQTDAAIQNEVYPLVDRGNYKAAITRIDRLIAEVKPPRAQLQLLMAFKGQLYYSLGEKTQAMQFLDEAIAIDPKSESAGRARAAKLQVDGGR